MDIDPVFRHFQLDIRQIYLVYNVLDGVDIGSVIHLPLCPSGIPNVLGKTA